MVTCGEGAGAGLVAKSVSFNNACMGEGSCAALAAKWVSVSNGYVWRGALGGPGCQSGKRQQMLHVERSLVPSWLPSG